MSAPEVDEVPIEGLQSTLAAEHAAVWIHGVLGGQVSVGAQPALARQVGAAYALHRARRDQLVRWVRDAGGEPVAAEVAYVLPSELTTVAQVQATARQVEDRCTQAYADLVGRTAEAQRVWAINALIDAAKREMGFGATAESLPGIPA